MELTIKKGGRLDGKRWNGDIREYEVHDVTEQVFSHLFDICTLEEGVTLRDIFLLINTQLDLFDKFLSNWTKELVEEALSDWPLAPDTDIKYLELYWTGGYDDERQLSLSRPEFHGWGVWPDDEYSNHPPGTEGGFAIEFSPVYEIVDLEVKLKDRLEIYPDFGSAPKEEEIQAFKLGFTLAQILLGIVWELSFCGPPEKRDIKKSKLSATVERIRELRADPDKYAEALANGELSELDLGEYELEE